MLNCVYHFSGDMQVVENDEKEKLLETGAWFDHPNKAKEYKEELMEVNAPKPKKLKHKKEESIL